MFNIHILTLKCIFGSYITACDAPVTWLIAFD